jgi:ATP-dependent Zn protease
MMPPKLLDLLKRALRGDSTAHSDAVDIHDYRVIRSVHEAGHLVAHWFSPFTIQIGAVTTNDKGTSVWSRAHTGLPQFDWDILVAYLAGLAGVMHAFGKTSTTGARDDLSNARQFAERLCAVTDDPHRYRLWSCDETAFAPDFSKAFRKPLPQQTQDVMASAFRRAREMIAEHDREFWLLAEAVRENEILRIYEIEAILGKRQELDKKTLESLLRLSGR